MASPELPELAHSPGSPDSPQLPLTPQLPRSVGFVRRGQGQDVEMQDQAAGFEQADEDRTLGLNRAHNTEEGGGDLADAFVARPVPDLSDNVNTRAQGQGQAQARTETQAQAAMEVVPPALPAAHNHSAQLRYPILTAGLAPHPSPLNHPSLFADLIPTPSPATRRVRLAINIEKHMPTINALSARLQNALEVFNDDSWPMPPLPGRLDALTVVLENGTVLQAALSGWRTWGMSMSRWSGEGGLVDGVVRRIVAECEGELELYAPGVSTEKAEKQADEKDEVDEKMDVEEGGGAIGGGGKGKEREVEGDADGADAAVGSAENTASGISPTDTDQHAPGNDTGSTTVLTPQPNASSSRIVEVSSDLSTGGSEYITPQEESPLPSSQFRPTMTSHDDLMMTRGGNYLTVDPREQRSARQVLPGCGKRMFDMTAVEESPEPDYSPKAGDDEESFSENVTMTTGGVTYDLPTTETASVTENADVTMTTEESDSTTNNADTIMTDASSETQAGPTVPGVSITSPSGESSIAIENPTTPLSKSQKKNAARKKAGYKKTKKAKKQKTSHASDEASTSTAASQFVPSLPFDLRNRATHPPFTFTPSPEMMPHTFTNLITHHPTLLVHPILTLTFFSTTPTSTHPDRLHSRIICHYEVGLDGVETIIQGEVSIPETGSWKRDVREARVGKLGMKKEGAGGMDADLCKRQLAAGHGRGMWLFFAIRWRRTVRDCQTGLGGKWVCFGAPVEALKRREGRSEVVNLNHLRDVIDKAEVGERLMEFRRMDVRFSTGGVPCFDLMYGAEDGWNGGVWEKVKGAMAEAGCVVSFLFDGQEVGGPKQKRFWGVLEKEDVGPFYTEGLMEDIPGLLPGFRMQGTKGLGLAEPGIGCVAPRVAEDEEGKGKGKGKAATVEDCEDEHAAGGGGEEVEGKGKEAAADLDKKLMPPPPTPLKGKSPKESNDGWEMAKKALVEGQRKSKAEAELEALCGRMEKASLETYQKGLRRAGIKWS